MKRNFAYFLGVLCGDGYISKEGMIEIKVELKEYGEFLTKIIEELYGKKAKIIFEKYNNHSYYRVYFYSKSITRSLDKYGLTSPKTFSVIIPKEIKKSDKRTKALFLRGLYDTDGSFYTKINKTIQNYPTINLESRSRELVEETYYILKQMRLNPKMTVYNKRNKPAFLLRLYGFKELGKYMRVIGFYHPEKFKKANKTINVGIKRVGR